MQQHVIRTVFDSRIFLFFAGISFVTTAILAALFIVSRYAIASYATDQIARLPWDITLGQQSAFEHGPAVRNWLSSLPVVKDVQQIGFLRARNGNQLNITLDGSPVSVAWITILAATSPELLPPETRPPADLQEGSTRVVRAALVNPIGIDSMPIHAEAGSILELSAANVGASGSAAEEPGIRPASLIRWSDDETTWLDNWSSRVHGTVFREGFRLVHGDEEHASVPLRTIYSARLVTPTAQMDRQEFNKWMLDHVGSMAYMPGLTLVLQVPPRDFVPLAGLFQQAFKIGGGFHGAESSPPFAPELIHLVSLDRDNLVSPWKLDQSAERVGAVAGAAHAFVRQLDTQSYSRSNLQAVLGRMGSVARNIGVITLLIALPLLFLCWSVASAASELLLMNERRLIGLLLVRGVSMTSISRHLRSTFLKAGLVGGTLGILVGIALPVLGWAMR